MGLLRQGPYTTTTGHEKREHLYLPLVIQMFYYYSIRSPFAFLFLCIRSFRHDTRTPHAVKTHTHQCRTSRLVPDGDWEREQSINSYFGSTRSAQALFGLFVAAQALRSIPADYPSHPVNRLTEAGQIENSDQGLAETDCQKM